MAKASPKEGLRLTTRFRSHISDASACFAEAFLYMEDEAGGGRREAGEGRLEAEDGKPEASIL